MPGRGHRDPVLISPIVQLSTRSLVRPCQTAEAGGSPVRGGARPTGQSQAGTLFGRLFRPTTPPTPIAAAGATVQTGIVSCFGRWQPLPFLPGVIDVQHAYQAWSNEAQNPASIAPRIIRKGFDSTSSVVR